jgi:cytidylate kinase
VKSVITISRQMGSGGRAVAEQVAVELGWRFVSKELVTETARQTGFDESKIERIFDQRLSLQDRITYEQRSAKYLEAVSKVIREFVDEGNMVILGRGAHVIMAGDPRIFRVHIVADLETRIQRMASAYGLKGKKGLAEARHRVIDSDYGRSAFHLLLFNVDWNNPLIYELVVNTTDVDLNHAAAAILSAFKILGR